MRAKVSMQHMGGKVDWGKYVFFAVGAEKEGDEIRLDGIDG